jgi:hypothetical protein
MPARKPPAPERPAAAAESSAPSVAAGPHIPKRTEWLSLPEPYGAAGMRALVWTNYPNRYLRALQGGAGADGLEDALKALVIEHNGWLGEDGEPLGDCQSEGFWWSDAASAELVAVVRELLLDAPFAMTRFRRRNGTGS